MRILPFALAATLPLLSACAGDSPGSSGLSGPAGELGITVAPLTLDGVGNAVYTVTVTNDAVPPETVWTRQLSADRFGDGVGAISYVGPCDAQDNDNDGVALHRVTLTLDALYDTATPANALTDWQNPTPVYLDVECVENADTPVTFNLTVMREANQGFFDLAVNFQNIFCSAKLDCEYGPDRPIELLFDPVTGDRVPTAVIGLACSAGGGEAATHLYFDAVTLTCDGVPLTIPLDHPAEGNIYGASSPAPAPLLQAATWRGLESLTNDTGESLNKVYFNIGIAPDLTGITTGCSLSFAATASPGPLVDPFTTPPGTTWPVIHFNRDDLVVIGDSGAELGCGQSPLNDPLAPDGTGVYTDYTTLQATRSFRYEARDAGSGAVTVRENVIEASGVLGAPQGFWGVDGWETNDSDPSDDGLAGVTVAAYDLDGNLISSTQTLADGSWSLPVIAGDYELRVDSQSLAFDGRSGGLVSVDPIILTGAQTDAYVQAYPPSDVDGVLFADVNANFSYTGAAGQTLLPNTTISFYSATFDLTFEFVTDQSGAYDIQIPGNSDYEVSLDFNEPALTDMARLYGTLAPEESYWLTSLSHGDAGTALDIAVRPRLNGVIEIYIRYQYPDITLWDDAFTYELLHGTQVDLYDMTDPATPVFLGSEVVELPSGDFYTTVALFGTRDPMYGPSTLVREGVPYRVVLRDDLAPIADTFERIEVSSDGWSEWAEGTTFDVFFPIGDDGGSTPLEDFYFDVYPLKGTIEASPVFYDVNRNGTYEAGVDALLSGIDISLWGPNGEDMRTSDSGLIRWSDLHALPDSYDMWVQGDWWGEPATRPIPDARLVVDGYGIFPLGFGETVKKAFHVQYDTNVTVSLTATVTDSYGFPVPGVTLTLTPKTEVPIGVTGWDHWPLLIAGFGPTTEITAANGIALYDFYELYAGFYTLTVDEASLPDGYTLLDATPCDVFVTSAQPNAECAFTLGVLPPSSPDPLPFEGVSNDGTSSVTAASPTWAFTDADGTRGFKLDTATFAEAGSIRLVDARTESVMTTLTGFDAVTHTDVALPNAVIPWDDDGTALVRAELVADSDGAVLATGTFSVFGPVVDVAVDEQGFAGLGVIDPNDPRRLTLERLRGVAPGVNYVVAFSGSSGVLVGYSQFTEPVDWPVTLDFLDQPTWDHDYSEAFPTFCGGFAPESLCSFDGGYYEFKIMTEASWALYGTGPGQENDLQTAAPHLYYDPVALDDWFYILNP